MKTNKFRCRPASIAKTRWAAYAAAGAATALAGPQSAEAAVHYSGILNESFPPDKDIFRTFPLDQPGDSLFFGHANTCEEALFSINGIVSAAFRGNLGYFPYVSRLPFGQNISSGRFVTGSGFMAASSTCLDSTNGPWGDRRGTGYVGFRFNNGAGVQYGWVRVTISGGHNNAFRVVAYAYGDPGEPITAGQRSSDERPAEQGSLGWLAAGAMGLLAWRRSRSLTARSN
jgi:hypothetical protein